MKVGILATPGSSAPTLARTAEELGFHSIWFVDSPLVFGDIWVTLGACAAQTSRIQLATGVTNPVTRSAAVVASALASLNAHAPGRVVFGIGTGYTATGAMDLRSASASELRRFVEDVRGMLSGEDLEVGVYGGERRYAGFVNQTLPWIDLTDPIPVCVAAAGPRILREAATLADYILLGGIASPEVIAACIEIVRDSRQSAGFDPTAMEFVITPSVYVTDRDIDLADPTDCAEMRELLGPKSLSPAGNFSRVAAESPRVPRDIAGAFAAVRNAYAPTADDGGDPKTAHLRRYRGYMTELTDRQRPLVTTEILRATTICGSPHQCRDRITELAAAGIDHVVLSPLAQHAGSVLERFGSEVLPGLRMQ